MRLDAFGHNSLQFLPVKLLLQFGVVFLQGCLPPAERARADHDDVDVTRDAALPIKGNIPKPAGDIVGVLLQPGGRDGNALRALAEAPGI